MKLSILALAAAALVAAPALVGCGGDPNDKLTGPSAGDLPAADQETSLASPGNTFDHMDNPTGENGATDPGEVRALAGQVGTPEVVARLHGCTKLTYAALGDVLASRGVDVGQGAQGDSAGGLYRGGRAALGVANYGGRVPEALFASTSSMAKQFDIFIAAAGEILQKYGNAPACQGSTLVADNKLTKDGISCLLGKPAKDEHVALANNLVSQAQDPAAGQRLAIATLLEAAHTCE